MILRKPYAILIKNFKFIHVILTGFMLYILYKTWGVMDFFTEYFKNGESIVGQDIASNLINFQLYFFAVIIIAGLITVLVLMYLKEKPITYYIYSIVTYIFVIVIFVLTKNTIVTMEGQLVSARVARAMSDFTNIAFLVQVISVIMTFIRATGFDIKKFNFVKDLQELDIQVEDSEEFEVEMEVDTDKLTRNIKRRIRHLKYVYVENKLLINVLILVSVLVLGIYFYFKLGFADKKYNEGNYFYTNEFVMKVNRSYITSTDYKTKQLDHYKNLVVLEITAKRLYSKNAKLEAAKLELNVGDKHYYPTKAYKSQLKDLGNLYQDEVIPKDTEVTYLLAYEVPTNYLDKKMTLRYINGLSSSNKKLEAIYVNVKLNPNNLRRNLKNKKLKIGDTMDMKDTILRDSTFKINSYVIEDEFKLDYQFCLKANECIPSVEYIKPDILTNYSKTLLRLDTNLDLADNIQTQGVNDTYDFIKMFGILKYTLDGDHKVQKVALKQVVPKSAKAGSYTYIEVLSEVKNASNISIEFKLRNQTYEYILK